MHILGDIYHWYEGDVRAHHGLLAKLLAAPLVLAKIRLSGVVTMVPFNTESLFLGSCILLVPAEAHYQLEELVFGGPTKPHDLVYRIPAYEGFLRA